MELSQTVATLQDEVKLLKAEIKTVLKEIRTAVLSENNPFAIDASLPTARAAAGPGAGVPGAWPETPALEPAPAPLPPPPTPPPAPPPAAAPVGPTPQATAAPAPPIASAAPAGPAGLIMIPAGEPQPAPSPQAAPAPAPPAGAPTPRPVAEHEMPPPARTVGEGALSEPLAAATTDLASRYAERERTRLRPVRHEAPDRPPAQSWSLLTIAGLAAWAEDAVVALGPERFQIVLSLACFAELLPPDVRDVLARVAELAPVREAKDQPMNVIECLVVLHQLETTLQGEIATRLPRRREAA